MKAEKQFKKNKSILPLFISLIIILSFTIFASIYVITNNSSNEQNLNENSNPLKLGNLLQNQDVNPSLNLDDLILYHIFDSTYESRGSGSSSSSDDVNEEINLGNPAEDSTTNLNNEEPETNSPDSSDSVDNIQTSDDEKSVIDDKDDGFIDVIVMLKDDGVSDKMLGVAVDSPVEKKLSIIKSKVKTKQDEVLSTLDSSEFRIKHKYNTVSGFAGKITQEAWDKLERDPNVEAIYEDKMVYATLMDSVPLINANDIHDLGITGVGTVVCVVDTGIDYTHPDLGGCLGSGCKVIDGWDFVNNDSDPMDDYNPYNVSNPYGHGTHVAGIVAANGTLKGVAPDAELVAVKVLNNYGSGYFSNVALGIEWCNEKKLAGSNIVATTMSLSENGQYTGTSCPDWIDPFIDAAHDLDIAVIVASGNNWYSNGISYPACSPNAISVGSTTKSDIISGFTNTGVLLDLLAPGSLIYSTIIGGGYNTLSGTSMATPFVAGTIALAKQFLPTASPDEIVDVLKSSGVPIIDPDNNLSFSRIDLLAAARSIVECFSNSECDDSDPYTEDICYNSGTIESYCINLPIITCSTDSDCGTDGWVGDSYCQNDNISQDYITYTCNNPATPDSNCSYSIVPILIEECGVDGYSNNYCYDNDVYRDFIDRGCSSGSCFELIITEELVEECEHGCTEERCKIEICSYVGCDYY